SALVVDGLTLEMLGTALNQKTSGEDRQPKWLLRIVERLNAEFLEFPSVVQLAIDENVHPVYLARVFRRYYHQSIGEYVRNLQVKYSAELMLDLDLSLAQIALQAGFSDQSHFTRVYKQATGTTPGKYRKMLER
ncbi:MAG: helix-turn-helix transcriptional regulator, partial [Acidobacteria bacterium]|nr:helix-turn-helix transcriptional regulator [Acidobacteriota bacterium]